VSLGIALTSLSSQFAGRIFPQDGALS
jgi:hypothetical protein